MQPRGTQITCPNCHQPFSAILEQIIDVGRDPQAKARLLSGRTNLVTCPHCGYQSMLGTPLVYHDPAKELLLVYVPMELNLPRQEQERLIGSMTNAIINSLPQEQRKGYLLTPKMMLSMQGMIETILEADGITKEVLDKQRAKMRLVETFLQTDPDSLPDLVKQHDSEIDNEFFAILAAAAETAIASGRRDVAEQALAIRERILELSTTGQELLKRATEQEATIRQVASALDSLGERASYDDLVSLVFQLANDGGEEALQALVGLARPMLDYQFFQTLAARMEKAEGEDKEAIAALRDVLLDLTNVVDQQNEEVLRQATETLRSILGSPNPDEAIRQRLELLDETFMMVLSANIQHAEEAKDIATAARLKQVYDKVLAALQENAPPSIRFINEIMQIPDLDTARAAVSQRATEFGPELLQWFDLLAQDLASRGNNAAIERLTALREEAVKVLGEDGANVAEPERPRPQLVVPPARKRPRKE